MKRKVLLSLTLLAAIAVGIPSLRSYPTGTPSDGRTGSPGDNNKTCADGGCHAGAAVSDANGIITSNIPTEGYTPGASYTITVTVDGSGKKGLCVSPQKADGTVMGTLTAGTGNQMVGKGYITHTTPITATPAVWTFTWVAPAKGSGAVDFYGAFANNKTVVRKTKVTYQEKIASGVNENTFVSRLSAYPNPVVEKQLSVDFQLKQAAMVKISLIDITGKEVVLVKEVKMVAGIFEEKFDLAAFSSGVYFLHIASDKEVLNRKLLIQ